MMTILLLDDDRANLMLMQNSLVNMDDCQTVSFPNPKEALAWCIDNDPDLVLTDYMMPVMNGLDFIGAFRQLSGKAETPLIMITAAMDREVRMEALALGANDFLEKPIDSFEISVRVKNLLALRRSQKALSDRATWLVEEVRKATSDIVARERESIFRLARMAEYRDPDTGTHIIRMAYFCMQISSILGYTKDEQELILAAAPMHDIGKIGIPDAILLKPGKFTDAEMTIMKQHPVIGHEILRDSPSKLHQLGAEISLTHHEKFDGSGYPNGLKGEAIPLSGRIVALCDVFDALTSVRPYKKSWAVGQAMAFIERSNGSHFDPKVVAAFKQTLPEILRIRDEFRDPVISVDETEVISKA